jgi:hypothetical protein
MKKRNWTEAELVRAFDLTPKFNEFDVLMQWLNCEEQPIDADKQVLFAKIIQELNENVEHWNEEELKMNFISILLNIFVEYKSHRYRTYYEREIKAKVDGIDMNIKTDFMIAKGIFDLAENPYLCFHEYKRTNKNASEPSAQVLEAMLIAQVLNNNPKPVYGVYLVGRFWYFMAMDSQRHYGISKPYIATEKDQLLQIIGILRKFKYILETELLD